MFTKKTWIIIISITIVLGAILILAMSKFSCVKNRLGKYDVREVYSKSVINPVLTEDDKNILFFSSSLAKAGFYSLDLVTKNITSLSESMDTPENILWNKTRDKAILSIIYDQYIFEKYSSPFKKIGTPDGALTNWLYDFTKKTISPFDDNISPPTGGISWSPSGYKIAYYYNDRNGTSNISVSDPDGKNWQKILDLPDGEYRLGWLDGNNLYYYSRSLDYVATTVLKVNLKNKETIEITPKDSVLEAKSSGSHYLLIRKFNDDSSKVKLAYLDTASTQKEIFELDDDANIDLVVLNSQNDLIYFSSGVFKLINLEKKTRSTIKPNYKEKFEEVKDLSWDSSDKNIYFTSKDNLVYKMRIK